MARILRQDDLPIIADYVHSLSVPLLGAKQGVRKHREAVAALRTVMQAVYIQATEGLTSLQ